MTKFKFKILSTSSHFLIFVVAGISDIVFVLDKYDKPIIFSKKRLTSTPLFQTNYISYKDSNFAVSSKIIAATKENLRKVFR